MNRNFGDLLRIYLERIGDKTNQTLEAAKECLSQRKQKFDEKFHRFFIGKANARISVRLDQFVAFHRPNSLDEPSIKQEIDVGSNVKVEHLEQEFNCHSENFNVWNPFDDQPISATPAVNAESQHKSNGSSEKIHPKKMQKQRKHLEKSVQKNANKERTIPLNKLMEYKCDICSHTTKYKSHFLKHQRVHSGEKPFKCTLCLMEFSRKDDLIRHMRTHGNEFPFKCSICRLGFSLKSEWKSHETKCNKKRFECDLCEYVTLKKSDIVRHMRIHSAERPFQCEICAKRFNQKENLKKHMRIHSGEKPFKCDICAKRFTNKHHVNRHMRIHANEFLFQCSKCLQGFSHRNQLESHQSNCNQPRF